MLKGKSFLRFTSALCAASIAATLLCTSPVSAASAARKLGDVDGDGTVSINDVTYLQYCLADFYQLDKTSEIAADVNFDGEINIDDATIIMKYLAGQIRFIEPFMVSYKNTHRIYSGCVVTADQNASCEKFDVQCASDWTVKSDSSWVTCRRTKNGFNINISDYYIFRTTRQATITLTTKTERKKYFKIKVIQKNSNSEKLIQSARYGSLIYNNKEYIINVPQAGQTYISSPQTSSNTQTISFPQLHINWTKMFAGIDLGECGDPDYAPKLNVISLPLSFLGNINDSVSRDDLNFTFKTDGKDICYDKPDNHRTVTITRHSTEANEIYSKYAKKNVTWEVSAYWKLSGSPLEQATMSNNVKNYIKTKVSTYEFERIKNKSFDYHVKVSSIHADNPDTVSYVWLDKNKQVMETPYCGVEDSVSFGYGLYSFTPVVTYDYKELSKSRPASQSLVELFRSSGF